MVISGIPLKYILLFGPFLLMSLMYQDRIVSYLINLFTWLIQLIKQRID